jgi:hypothetical protein
VSSVGRTEPGWLFEQVQTDTQRGTPNQQDQARSGRVAVCKIW